MSSACSDGEAEAQSTTAANYPARSDEEGGGARERGPRGDLARQAAGDSAVPRNGTVASARAVEPAFAGESCDGCARFDVPMNASDQFGMFEMSLPRAVDMTDTTITWRLRAVEFRGTTGGVAPYVRDERGRDQCFIWRDLTELATWTNVTCEFSERFPGGAHDAPFNNDFDRSSVAKLGVQIHSGRVEPGAVYANALVYLDSITFSDGVTPDITFETDIGDLKFLPADSTAPARTNVAHLNQ